LNATLKEVSSTEGQDWREYSKTYNPRSLTKPSKQLSGTEFAKVKEDAAAIMRNKQAAGMDGILLFRTYANRCKADAKKAAEAPTKK